MLTIFAFAWSKKSKADTVAEVPNYLVLDRACKNTGSVVIPYLEKSSSLFVFSILRDGEWRQVYCADLGKSASSYTNMTRDDSILSGISPQKRQLLSYIPAFGLGSSQFPMPAIQDPKKMGELQKTYGILMQGYVWSVLKGVISIDDEGHLVGVSSLRAVFRKLNEYTYRQAEGNKFFESFLQSLKARVEERDDYSQVEQIPTLFFRTKKLANKNPYEMTRTQDGGFEYVYVDKKKSLEKGRLEINTPLLTYQRVGDTYIFTVSAQDAEEFIRFCEESNDRPMVSLRKTTRTSELEVLEGWISANQNKSHQNFIYLEGKEMTKTAKSYIAFDVSKEELIPITVYKRDGLEQSIPISGAEFALQRYLDSEKRYETIMNFEETQVGLYTLNISKKILLDDSDNSKLKFRVKEVRVPDGYSGKSAFSQNISGEQLAKGNISFTAYNYRRKIKLAVRKVDGYLLDYKMAQFLSAKAELQFPYQDPTVYELKYQGEDESGEPIYRSDYDELVAKVLGEEYTDEHGVFEQEVYTRELGRTLLLSYLARLDARFDVYEYSRAIGTYKSEPLVTMETRAVLGGEVITDFLLETEDNEGKLMICETKYPVGYESGVATTFYIEMNDGNDQKTVTLSNESTGEFVSNAISPRRIILEKKVREMSIPSLDGTIVVKKISPKSAVFAVYADENIGLIGDREYLYRQNDLVCTVEIGEDGIGMTPYLYPGKYKIVEIKAPKYCCPLKEERMVTIAGEDVHVEIENIPITEEIRIRKRDGEGDGFLQDAVLGLYANQDFMLDGVRIIKKDTLLMEKKAEGDEVVFSGLPFGTYYVKEREAPAGYEKTEAKLEFDEPSMPKEKEKVILYGVLSNFYKAKRKLIVRKEIATEDIYLKHGNPTFLFRVKGKAYDGTEHTFERAIVFTREDIKEGEAIQKKEIVFENLISGTYEAEELFVARYRLKEIKDIVAGVIEKDKAKFDLEQNEVGEVTFVNEKYEWQGFSHNDIKINSFESAKQEEKEAYLRGLAVTCSDFMTAEKVDESKLKVYAQYADGTARELALSQCEIKPDTMNLMDSVFTNVMISYTEDGVTVKAEIPILYYEINTNLNLYRTVNISDGTIAIIGYMGGETQVAIPAMIDGKVVSRLGRNYVSGKDIYVEEGRVDEETARKNIEYYKVSGLEHVKKLTLPNTVKTIGYASFYEYGNLEEVEFNQAQIIKGQSFCKTGLRGELILPDDVITVGNSAFRETKISSLKLSSRLQSLGSKVFYQCFDLTGILRVPILLGTMKKETFYHTNLTQVIFEGELSKIESSAFRENRNLSLLEFLNCNVKKISSNAFYVSNETEFDTMIYGANETVKSYPWKEEGRNPIFE